jgi:hypothetical protein
MTQTLEGNFNPSFHFLGLIQKAMADGVTRHCVQPGCPEVYIVPAEQAYFTTHPNIEALEALCLTPRPILNVALMPDWHLSTNQGMQVGRVLIHRKNPAKDPELIKRPLPELLWYAALCASDGQLLQGSHADTPVRLKSCPDFSQLFHREHEPVLAAFMLEESVALTTVAEKTKIPLALVFEFYNACAVLDLIELSMESGNIFEPGHYLFGLLKKANADGQMRRCVMAGQPPLYLAPVEGKYYTDMDSSSLAKLCAVLLSELEVSIVDSSSDEEEVVQIGRAWVRRKKKASLPKMPPGHSLSGLLFRASLHASQGRLLSGYDLNAPVHLKSWPDKEFLREAALIKEERYFFPLAAFMSTKTVGLPEIANANKLPIAQVIDFHNACALAGLLENPL